MAKIKRPYEQMKRAADDLREIILPACERIEIAGSIRRQCPTIGDIELIAIPKHNRDLFGYELGITQLDWKLGALGFRFIRDGPKYKSFEIPVDTEICQVDLFVVPDPETWGVLFMIRTGSAAFSKKMVTRRAYGGFMPNNLKVYNGRVWPPGTEPLETPEEIDVFDFWGMSYPDPEDREIPLPAKTPI